MPNFFYTAVSVDTLLDSGHQAVSVDASLGNVNLSLETTAFKGGRNYLIWRRDVSGNTVTVIPNGEETVGGAVSLVVAPGDKIMIVSDPVVSNWEVFTYT